MIFYGLFEIGRPTKSYDGMLFLLVATYIEIPFMHFAHIVMHSEKLNPSYERAKS